MNRLSLIRYTSAVALGLSTLWSAAVCAAEDAGAFDKIQQIRAGDLNIGYVDIGPRDGQPVILQQDHRLALRHSELCPGGAGSSAEGLPGDRAVSAWLRHDPFPLRQHAA